MKRPVIEGKSALNWAWLSAAVVALDQLVKWYVVGSFGLYEIRAVAPFLDLTRLHNEGAAFSILADAGGWQRWFFLALAAAIGVAIVLWLRSLPARGQYWLAVGLALILGGALGNAWDRFADGYVVDYLHFHWGERYFPAFNVADIAITTGAIMLIIDALLDSRRRRARVT
ncbi:MAG TPA: signal peptidase II [Steroidobacteraceae bacterium]|nr:signal peptidase II [Steroidobacteraceae bacterium]